ncbi:MULTISPECIES: alkaline phosphatase [Rhodococcus]|uniref:alkaline phosphatase D family protein n=1 Tax=Rhodococcus TaxID=1827 RepID=UPI000BDAA2EC|nr:MULTISPECIES: alkaline phosphatase D family protein [unclassified Rhodococcus (in: high G+C Gram-positive bacteria)]MBP1160117.1 alkaline phosphatase D [Rhodococcus sp. PvR099]PTR41334.1 alkaline phosphatase D [Rhodococcus sp. OK611]SNX92156.1 alkaline phosphatase D [Rhodococcus sp. OK270]
MSFPPTNVSRRAFLAGLSVLGGATLLPAAANATPVLRQAPDAGAGLIRNPEFGNGVMAGVPRTDGATLWTRVGAAGGTGSLETGSLGGGSVGGSAGGSAGSSGAGGELALVVSRREDLSSPVLAERVQVREDADGTVHFDVNGLAPGETYYYQFRGNGGESPVGRFRTLRPADSNEPVRIGWFTCQGFEEGYYAAHRHLAEEDLDFVVCLGDYVYEFTKPGVRGVTTNPFPQTIDAMRDKYRQYRTDANLRQMHSQHAFIPIWDDHEFRNNYSKDGWTFPVISPIEGAVGFQQKKQWAWQSWFEHMPVPRFANDPTRTYRSLRVGKTVELFAPDTRQYRDRQACGDSLDHIVCAEADAAGRTMLGSTQKQWLLDGMTRSDARWKVVANANMMMGMVVADNGTRAYMDTWDGYGAERAEILSTAAQSVDNLVLVTGDDHDGWAGELWDTGFAPGTPSGAQANAPGTRRAGVEFVVPSVTSANTADGGYTSSSDNTGGARAEEVNRRDKNPHVKHADMVSHGYGVLEVDASEARFQFRTVDKLNPNSGVETTKALRTPAGQSVIETL